jgi:hypothetical protein
MTATISTNLSMNFISPFFPRIDMLRVVTVTRNRSADSGRDYRTTGLNLRPETRRNDPVAATTPESSVLREDS